MENEFDIAQCLAYLKEGYILSFVNSGMKYFIGYNKKKIKIMSNNVSFYLEEDEFYDDYKKFRFKLVEKEENYSDDTVYEQYYSWKQ